MTGGLTANTRIAGFRIGKTHDETGALRNREEDREVSEPLPPHAGAIIEIDAPPPSQ